MKTIQCNLDFWHDKNFFNENDGILISHFKSHKRVITGVITRKKVLELITKNIDEIPELIFLLQFIFEVDEYSYTDSKLYIELENGAKLSIYTNSSKIFELLTKD